MPGERVAANALTGEPAARAKAKGASPAPPQSMASAFIASSNGAAAGNTVQAKGASCSTPAGFHYGFEATALVTDPQHGCGAGHERCRQSNHQQGSAREHQGHEGVIRSLGG